jgi:hypothetical protein
LISSIGALLRISLRRSRADWPIVVSAGLICLVASTLLAAGVIYGGAVSAAGLRRALEDAPVSAANIAVTSQAEPADADRLDQAVGAELRTVFGPTGGTILREVRSGSFALPGQPPDSVRDLAVLDYAEGLADRATLVAGAWPADGGAVTDAIPVAVTEDVAASLGLTVGERLRLENRTQAGFFADVEVTGIVRITDPTAKAWFADEQTLAGQLVREPYVIHGPFFTTERQLLTRAAPATVQLGWHAFPDVSAVGLPDLAGLQARAAALPGRLDAAIGHVAIVQTDLPATLARIAPSLLVARTGVLVLTVQLVALALFAVLLSASLLTEHRRIDTAMLRSRGAGRRGIVALAVIEALLLTVPAALVAPWLATLTLQAFNVIGPLADIGMAIAPQVTADAYVAAAAAAGLCLVALVLPVARAERSLSAVRGSLARGETQGVGQRLGLDIALLVVAGIGLWQLRSYGAPLTRSLQGSLGVDPLLVVTPTIGLVAGAILALRIVPLVARLIESVAARARGLVPALGARQLSRRPLRYTRAAALLILAMAMGVFAASYAFTWTASQRDQATYQVGAAVRVQPGRGLGSSPEWAMDRRLAAIPGVTAVLPVERESATLPVGSRTGRIVALDAAVAPAVVVMRPDVSGTSLAELMAPLAAGRPTVTAVPLPGSPEQLRLTVDIDLRTIEHSQFDEATGEDAAVEADTAEVGDWKGLGASIVVRDAVGLLHRFTAPQVTIDGGPHELVIPLGGGSVAGASLADPLELFAVDLGVSLPEGYQATDATVTVHDVAVAGPDAAWRAVPLDLADGWRTTASIYGREAQIVTPRATGPELVAAVGQPHLDALPGIDRNGRALALTFAPTAVGDAGISPAPIIASDAFLTATGSHVGDTMTLPIGGLDRPVRISGSVHAFPTGDPTVPTAIIDLATLSLLRFEGDAAVQPPDEWWLSADAAAVPAIVDSLTRPPAGGTTVVSLAGRSRALSTDPVALGAIGALGIGFVAAAIFAVIGFVVSAAVSARERVAEFALLRALGLSTGQLSVWLSLENAVLAAFSLISGTLLGLAIAWVVMPFITVTQGALTPYPPVEVAVPWSVIGLLEAAGAIALGATVVALAWSLPRIGLGSVLRMSED